MRLVRRGWIAERLCGMRSRRRRSARGWIDGAVKGAVEIGVNGG
jgi:hypothetical protein